VTCREFVVFIADFLSGELPDAVRQAFEGHLRACPNCARYLEGYRATLALEKQAYDDHDSPVPHDVPDELVDAILRARRTPLID
jgi:anti-sigma factor RsiW